MRLAKVSAGEHMNKLIVVLEKKRVVRVRSRCRVGRLGRSLPLKPTQVTLFTMILYNWENSIRDIRPFFHPLFCHSSVAKYPSSLLQ